MAKAAFPAQNGKIAFSNRSGRSVHIYRMNPDGSHVRRLTNDPAEDVYPDFSPDGEQIVYTRRRSHKATIYVMDADGSHRQNITNSSAAEALPTWGPRP